MIALLLMIRINYHHRLIMNKRRIPCLDGYLDRINLLLWPRFKARPPRTMPGAPVFAEAVASWPHDQSARITMQTDHHGSPCRQTDSRRSKCTDHHAGPLGGQHLWVLTFASWLLLPARHSHVVGSSCDPWQPGGGGGGVEQTVFDAQLSSLVVVVVVRRRFSMRS
jgi:Vps52 / Sac2 family